MLYGVRQCLQLIVAKVQVLQPLKLTNAFRQADQLVTREIEAFKVMQLLQHSAQAAYAGIANFFAHKVDA